MTHFPFEIPEEALNAAANAFANTTGSTTHVEKQGLFAALEAALPYLQFSPLGDNHHNAAMCPYCTTPK